MTAQKYYFQQSWWRREKDVGSVPVRNFIFTLGPSLTIIKSDSTQVWQVKKVTWFSLWFTNDEELQYLNNISASASPVVSCLCFSRYYCVNSWYTEELRARVPVQSDIAEIYALARVNYQLINWFNVAQQYAG